MARHWFGQSLTDWSMTLGTVSESGGVKYAAVSATAPVTVTFWNAATGGTQYTDLLDASDNPVTQITTADGTGALALGTIPRFRGPDSDPEITEMWADAGGGARYLMVATDLGGTIADLSFTSDFLAALEEQALTEGSVGQFLGKDPDPDSLTGLRWTAPPSGGGNGGSGVAWVDASSGAYAADRTGTSDARAAIQAAIDDVTASGGGVVYLPAGTYLIGYTADTGNGSAGGLQLKPNVWLRGDGIATRLEVTGTWSSDTGIVGIGDDATSQAVRDTRVSHLWVKGTAGTSHAEPVEHVHGLLFNTAGITEEPDAVHRVHDVTVWDCDRGIALLGTDDQAVMVQRVRGRWFRRQAILDGREGGGGGPDNYWAFIDVSSANRLAGGTYAGIEVHASNTHWVSCKAWYCKRDTAFVEGGSYKDGAGWYIGNVRNTFVACEAQDNGGHGIVVDAGKVTLSGCIADSNNHINNISGSALAHECSGVYIDASEVTLTGVTAFDRNGTAADRYQAHGYVINSGVRGLSLQGVAYDNRSDGSAADPLDGVHWVGGVPHASQEVTVLSAYGGSRATIANGLGVGTVHKRQSPGHTPVTGTALTDVTALSASVPGGSTWYQVDALIIYRADATNNARIGLELTSSPDAFCKVDWQADYTKPDGTPANEYSLSTYDAGASTTRYIVADGDGNVTGGGYSNQRSLRIVGTLQIGSAAVTGTITVQVAEDVGTGTGVKVIENSTLTVTPLTFT